MCPGMSFPQVLGLGMASGSQGWVNKASEGGLDSSDLLSGENEVLF